MDEGARTMVTGFNRMQEWLGGTERISEEDIEMRLEEQETAIEEEMELWEMRKTIESIVSPYRAAGIIADIMEGL